MIFFFRKKKVILDCFTYNKASYELFKIDYARKFYPDWWKKLPVATPHPKQPKDLTAGTMKGCAGIIDYYKSGFIIPLWTEAIIETGPIGSTYLRVALSDPSADSEQHGASQRGEYLPNTKFSHVKLNSPWLIEATDTTQFVMTKPIWNFDDPTEFIVPPGALNFYYQHSSNVNLFFKHKQQEHKIHLDPGIPIVHLIPQTEKRIEIRTHYLSKNEWLQRHANSLRFSFVSSYTKYVSARKKNDKMRD